MEYQLFREQCRMEDAEIQSCLKLWENLDKKSKAKGYDDLVEHFGPVDIISALKLQYYQKENELAELLIGSRLGDARNLKYSHQNGENVIATYYHRMSNGGVQRVLSELLFLWVSMGYQVILITDEDPAPDDYPIPASVRRRVIPDCVMIKAGEYKDRARALQELIVSEHIERVIYHAHIGSMLFWDLCLFQGNGIPVDICTHGVFTHLVLRGAFQNFLKMPSIYRLAEGLLVLSETDAEFYRSLGLSVKYLPNPVRITVPKDQMSAVKNHRILWVGRISKEKNPSDVISVMKRVLEKVPDAVLDMVGTGDEKLVEQVKRKVQEAGLEKKIQFCGYQKDVSEYYRRSSVFISTSMSEGFPCTLVESRQFGLPAVYYELPYVELMKDGKGVLSVAQNDKDAMADAVIQLLLDDALRSQMGREARESIEDFAAFDYETAWRSVLEGNIFSENNSFDRTPDLMMYTFMEHFRVGLIKEREALERKYTRECDQKVEEVKNSLSYRLGHKLVWLPGKIKKILKNGHGE